MRVVSPIESATALVTAAFQCSDLHGQRKGVGADGWWWVVHLWGEVRPGGPDQEGGHTDAGSVRYVNEAEGVVVWLVAW